ncbi:MAG: tyrosine-type recombinase/integrase [Spirochaetia bacterium]|nr:tyrosine-type recombinase/integrase [Spirochaetia bacterium]
MNLLVQFEDYLAIERNRSPHTLRAYLADLREYFLYLEANKLLYDRIQQRELRGFFAEITGAGMRPDGKIRKRKLDARSQRRKLASIRTFYSMLVLRGHLQESPAKDVRPPRIKRKLPGFVPYDEMRRLLEEAKPTGHLAHERLIRDRAIMEILYSSGMRISELLSLENISANQDLSALRILGKGRRERIVFLGVQAQKALREYLEVRPEFHPVTARLFVNRDGTELSDRGVRKNMVRLERELGLARHLHPHRFRHSMATDLLNEGADIRAVQELLGHKSLASTQIYTGVSKDRLKDVYRQSHPHGRSNPAEHQTPSETPQESRGS